MPYTFLYFNVRGRAQPIRYLLEDNAIPYEDKDVTFPEWKDMKPKMKFGQLPCLLDGDLELVQSGCIIRHLARKHKVYGENDNEAAMVDMLREVFVDMREKMLKLVFAPDADYEAGKKAYSEELPAQFKKLEGILKANNGGTGFFVGSKVSFADYSMLDVLMNIAKFVPGCLDTDETTCLKEFVDRMCKRPNLAKFMASDKFKNCPITIKDRLL